MSTDKKFSTREKIAFGVSAAIVASAVVYWVVQIIGVWEMMQLAGG